MLCLQDPHNISEKSLLLPLQAYFVISHFDGRHSILDIQAEYMRRFGDFLFGEKIQEMIDLLEHHLFLEGDRFQEALRLKEEVFRRSSIREPALAGRSYEREPERLKDQMSGYFGGTAGPGPIGMTDTATRVKAVVAPHIDFQRGGACYAFAHREIRDKTSAACFVVFGTAHIPMQHPFCLTRKDFITPLGPLEAHKDLIDSIQAGVPYDLFADETVHRNEHSIEFQCLFLRFLRPDPVPLKIVPILTGSFHESVEKEASPLEMKPVRQFIDSLTKSLSSIEEEICFVASADLAHMGPQFGDPEGLRDDDLRRLAEEDREMLAHVEGMDAEGFSNSIVRDRDRRRICGYPAIYAMLNTIEAQEGKLLDYRQAYTPETESVVTFASMAFYDSR